MDTRLLVLDLDGVLIDSSALNVAAFQYGLASLGGAVPPEAEVRALIGRPALDMLRLLGCPAEQTDTVFQHHVRPYYLEHFASLARAYPGAGETLEALVGSGWTLAACTSGTRSIQEPALSALGLLSYFTVLHTACRSRHRKPHPAYMAEVVSAFSRVQELWHVEDTEEGIEMGLANGAVTVFAEYGYGRLSQLTPHYRIQEPSQLLALLVAKERWEIA